MLVLMNILPAVNHNIDHLIKNSYIVVDQRRNQSYILTSHESYVYENLFSADELAAELMCDAFSAELFVHLNIRGAATMLKSF